MRISDWSSDVCSSDLEDHEILLHRELDDLVDGIDLAAVVAQRRRTPEAVGAGHQDVGRGHVASATDREGSADRVVLVVALLEGQQVEWQGLLDRKRTRLNSSH